MKPNRACANPCRACGQHPGKRRWRGVCRWCHERAKKALAIIAPEPKRWQVGLLDQSGNEVSGAGYARRGFDALDQNPSGGFVIPPVMWTAAGHWGTIHYLAVYYEGHEAMRATLTHSPTILHGDSLSMPPTPITIS